eukprot:GHVN01067334.1.p2 GENE.GHVN01067334.1~~GHVN01067334.1.p2  ORF type:complete len:857 (+),score=123.30 GHVN01067334.1:4809-7379(+)
MVVRPGRQHGGGGPGGSGGALGAGGYGSGGVGAGDSANDGWVSPSKHQSMSERLYSNRYYLAGALVLVVGDVVGCLTLDEKAQSENGKIVPVLTAAVVRLIANAILVTGAVWVGSLSIRKPWAEVGDDEAATEDDTSSESEARVKDSARNKVAAIQKMKATGASDLLVPLLMEPQQPLSLSALCEVSTTSVLAPPKAGTDSDSETDNLNTNCKDIKEQGCSASKSKVPTTTDSTQTGDVTVNLEDALNDDDEASKTDFSGRQRRAKPGGAITFANLAEELQFKRHVKRVERVAHYRRNVLIGCLFGIVVASNFVNGITCVTFPYPTDENGNITHDGFVMGFVLALMVLACNLQFLAFQRFVFNMTRDDGVLIPKIHAHKIYFNLKFTRSWCDVCRTLIRHEGYRCKVCQFDCCVNCFKRQGKHSDEGLLRCDNGPVPVKELTTFSYFLRAIRLMAPFMPLVIAALSCLVVNQGVDLMIPQYQGKIFDNVIKGDAEGFKSVLTVYVICNVLMAMFRGLQDLCVTVVWRYLRFEARMKMFEAVLKQDLAFFDGLMTGQITSRMNSDVEAMVQPCRTIMNVLLSNVIRLIGGFVMCAATSWKLTVLSFTSIAPIIYLTGLYARWSRSINLDIWQNLADGSAVATEAINNIRSVRAYGTDVSEHNKYKISMEIARSKGMKDSYASAGVGLVNNYLDFATGVLILGYGGAVVLNSEGKQLTLGNLITFQLYWNMMNYAYQALNGVINSMIRAAAAAERVFELIECTPVIEKGPDDLDYHKGIKLADEEMRGSLELSGVNFTYQMRPEKQVLKDINLRITPGTVCAFVGRSGGKYVLGVNPRVSGRVMSLYGSGKVSVSESG